MSVDPLRPGDSDGATALFGRDDVPRYARVLVIWDGGSAAATIPPGGKLTVGRSRECGLVVDHASISRRHVTVRDEASLTIEDHGSANGTSVNGVPLAPGVPTAVAGRSVIEIGACTMLVQPGARDEATAAAPMQRVRQLIGVVAKSDISVLLLGETGAGKDVAARRIHTESARHERPLVHLNCAAVPETLLESELFGHERGAFSGAAAAKPGLLEAAHGGTMFLDEIGEMALPLQAKLLRALESGEVRRLGSTTSRPIDVRFISASNRELRDLVEAGRFRADLYYRINGITIVIPPLRQRRDEIVPLARQFLAELPRQSGQPALVLAPETIRVIEAYAWPGNIRELRHAIERAALLSADGVIRASDLQLVDAGRAPASGTGQGLHADMGEAARRAIVEALERTGGNQTAAAKLLGISRRALLYRLAEMDLPRPRKGRSSSG